MRKNLFLLKKIGKNKNNNELVFKSFKFSFEPYSVLKTEILTVIMKSWNSDELSQASQKGPVNLFWS